MRFAMRRIIDCSRAQPLYKAGMSTAVSVSKSLRTDLQRPEAFGKKYPYPVELIETHISFVFLAGTDAYKVKKPVDLGFLDFRTIELRKQACDAEVTLNRRLSPAVYLGVVPVRLDHENRHTFVGDGPVVDWAVHMVRLPEEYRADRRLSAGSLQLGHIDRIAKVVAHFHHEARCDEKTGAFGTPEAVAVNVKENFEQTKKSVHCYVQPSEAREIERAQLEFLEKCAPLFHKRIAAGHVRDGHGDLRLEHIYLDDDGHVTIIDCIEFNDRFRYADTCADIAFLSMDLAWHGRVDLAEQFLALYARETGDFDLYPMVDFYEGYRAYVRGKIASLLASDPDAREESRSRAALEARRYFLLSLSAKRTPLIAPSVIAVGGLIASGKSTLSNALSLEMSAPVVDADRTRKQLLGVDPRTKIYTGTWSGAYDPHFTDKVYEEVMRRAGSVLASGRAVILDATFRSKAMRRSAKELSARFSVPFRFVECVVDSELCKSRLRRRKVENEVSDGRIEIFDEFAKSFEPVTELPAEEHIKADTSEPLPITIESIRPFLGVWPKGLTA